MVCAVLGTNLLGVDQGFFGGLNYRTVTLTVPLVWDDLDDQRTIDIFARIVARPGGENLPYLVFLQGGPGHEDPRPVRSIKQPSWIEIATQRFQVVMLDQRGTGRSTPVNNSIVVDHSSSEVAEYLTHLRADSIVRDAEAVREHLGVDRWYTLGQSFGGFTTLCYLSRYPQHVQQSYITGGLSMVGRHCDDLYALTYRIMEEKSEQFYRMFPGDRDKMRKAMDMAAEGRIIMPNGDAITPSRLRSLGMLLGSDDGAWTLHWMLDYEPGSNAFAYDVAEHLPFGGRNPLYAVIHESSYADGCRTDWSADRTIPQSFIDDPTLLTGEHVRREWFSTDSQLKPWAQVADLVAQVEWPSLYDAEALRACGTTGAAAVYHHDAYVPYEFSMETAALLPSIRCYVTSEHEHNGLRASDGAVLAHLFDLGDGLVYR